MSDFSVGNIVVGLIGVLLTIISTMAVSLLLDIRANVTSMSENLKELNGRQGRIEQWKEDHLLQDKRDLEHVEQLIDQCPARRA